jgi:hypothetical protein
MSLTNNETKAVLEALKALAAAVERQIPADEPPPPSTTTMWPATWQSAW